MYCAPPLPPNRAFSAARLAGLEVTARDFARVELEYSVMEKEFADTLQSHESARLNVIGSCGDVADSVP